MHTTKPTTVRNYNRMTKLTVDAVIVEGKELVLIKRKNPPFQNRWALPGGFVEYGEQVETACIREAKEETGLTIKIRELLGVYSKMGRDPRGHTISVVFIADGNGTLKEGSDAQDAKYFNLNRLPPLAFDHKKIIADAKWCLRT